MNLQNATFRAGRRAAPGTHLEDDENRIAHTELTDVAVHARHDVRDCLTYRDEDSQQFLGALPASISFLAVTTVGPSVQDAVSATLCSHKAPCPRAK